MAEISLSAKVQFLSRADSHAERPPRVETRQTHMSWLFLTDGYAYKLKKPICHRRLDYRTLAARRLNCEREVALNRRLAPDVYLGVVPLVVDRRGHLALGAAGEPVDYLVRMRRLHDDRTLAHAILTRALAPADIDRVGALLCAFFRAAPVVAIAPELYRQRFADRIDDDRRELLRPEFALPHAVVDAVGQAQLAFLSGCAGQLDARVRARRIVDCHGDLRPEHVYLTPEPLVIDCLEFDASLRALDPVDELAFLGVECERLGAREVGPRLLALYRSANADDFGPALAAYYASHRALGRARTSIGHLDDPEQRDRARWQDQTLAYLALAQAHAGRFAATPAHAEPGTAIT